MSRRLSLLALVALSVSVGVAAGFVLAGGLTGLAVGLGEL